MSKGWKTEQERKQRQRRRRRLMVRWGIAAVAFLGVLGGGYAYWRTNSVASPGGEAPAFALTDDGGQRVALEDFRRKKDVVLFFYMVNT